MTMLRTRKGARVCTGLVSMGLLLGGCGGKRVAAGAPEASGWTAVEHLQAGQAIEIQNRAGERVAGPVQQADADGVSVRGAEGPEGREGNVYRAARRDVARVTTLGPDRDSLRNGTLIGLAIGLGYAAVVTAALGGSDDPLGVGRAIGAHAITGAIGAGVGALIDLARRRPARRTIYRAVPK